MNGSMELELAIRLRGAVKRYGTITAVDGLDLDVPVGTCVGLLGPNGAGKSTTMRLLTAQSIADEGEIEVLGFRLPRESKMARAQCGLVPQLDNLDTTLTVAQNLLVFAHLYRIGRGERREAIARALVMAKLVDRRDLEERGALVDAVAVSTCAGKPGKRQPRASDRRIESMTHVENLPSYQELPVKEGAPPGSSWGLWGDDDQLGTLNLLTDERTRRAAAEVKRGAVFPLNLPLEIPGVAWRGPPHHHLLHVGPEGPYEADEQADGREYRYRDDYLDGLWLQGGSQWDGFTHVRHQEFGNYNGISDADVVSRRKLGIDQWSQRAIVGRGVLLDVQRHLETAGRSYDPASAYQFTVEDLEETIAAQGVTIEVGDIFLLHSGWTQRLLDADSEERQRILAWDTITAVGLEQSLRMVEYIWNLHVAAIGSDTLGVEAMEMGPDFEFLLHDHFLPLLGMPIGECWMLDALARDCAADGRYTFQLVSVPLNLSGGVGSPPQAVAIK